MFNMDRDLAHSFDEFCDAAKLGFAELDEHDKHTSVEPHHLAEPGQSVAARLQCFLPVKNTVRVWPCPGLLDFRRAAKSLFRARFVF